MPDIEFGTDGWRGVIAQDYTFENLKIVSQAVADYLGQACLPARQGKKIAVGYDTRFLSKEFAEASAKVFSSNGITVVLSDRAIPTPAVSLAVKTKKLDLGIMITASHNPAAYNGFKIKTASGGAAGPEITRKVESYLGNSPVKYFPEAQDKIKTEDLSRDYVRFIRSYIDFKSIKNKNFKVLVDSMFGSGDSFIAGILKGSKIRLEFIRNSINPSFGGGRPEPLEENLRELKKRGRKGKFDLGIALDGDADRRGAVSGDGTFIHPQKILGLLALHLNQDRKWSGGIVKTIAGTTMMDNIAGFLKVKLYETPVGFKYISNLMEKEDILTGGEEAGGMGGKGYIPERDGIVSGLLILEMISYRRKTLGEILYLMEKQFGRYYYLRRDLKLEKWLAPERKDLPGELLGRKVVQVKDYDGIKLVCEDESWLMFRASGTEAVMRLYSEARTLKRSSDLLKLCREIIHKLQ